MTTDPLGWVADYKEGNNFRKSQYTTTGVSQWDYAGPANRQMGTQVYLMGDGTSDSYAKIRNQVAPSDQNYTPLNMINMVSNDIQTVSIAGLS
ncbi:MAG: hypothetical protein GY881_06160 [Gammaproteobacteria bacterium]|nr:hypothetical protein [Gammaproteobacteria bacterium]